MEVSSAVSSGKPVDEPPENENRNPLDALVDQVLSLISEAVEANRQSTHSFIVRVANDVY